jgi:uncharacterized protein with HEPN domain
MYDADSRTYLLDMQEYAEQVMVYVTGRTKEEFLTDRQLRDAVAYNLQVIGEAAYKVNEAFKSEHPEIDWFKMAGLRHRIVHDYRQIDDETLWRITQKYVAPLLVDLRNILAKGG